jgi:hypothetical protein
MSARTFQIVFTAAGVLWVGGWGYLMFRYPEYFAKLNARWGLRVFSTPKGITFIRRMGMVAMTLAGLSVISEIVMLVFGFKWY